MGWKLTLIHFITRRAFFRSSSIDFLTRSSLLVERLLRRFPQPRRVITIFRWYSDGYIKRSRKFRSCHQTSGSKFHSHQSSTSPHPRSLQVLWILTLSFLGFQGTMETKFFSQFNGNILLEFTLRLVRLVEGANVVAEIRLDWRRTRRRRIVSP